MMRWINKSNHSQYELNKKISKSYIEKNNQLNYISK